MEWEQSSHQTEEGGRQIAFASHSIAAEKVYAHLDKEGLASIKIFAVKKFHGYLFERKFEIRSDHKPLQHVCMHMQSHISTFAVILSAYDYSISYKSGDQKRLFLLTQHNSIIHFPLSDVPDK